MRIVDKIFSLIYPNRCPCCNKLSETNEPCEKCAVMLTDCEIIGKVCRHCGLPKANCQCNKYHYLFDGVTAPFINGGIAQEGFYSFKFSYSPQSAEFFSHHMAESFKSRFCDINPDILCVVPSLRSDELSKNYEPNKLLAKRLSRELSIPLNVKLIKKVRKTEKQHKLSHDKRLLNVKGAYKVTKRLDGKTVLLLDDIKTTGYTLNECAKQLRMAGAERVYCVTALITVKSSCKLHKNEI